MSKNKLTILLFAIVIALTSYSFWRISIPRVLSIEEMKVNGFYKYGDSQEVREFVLMDHESNIFTKDDQISKKEYLNDKNPTILLSHVVDNVEISEILDPEPLP